MQKVKSIKHLKILLNNNRNDFFIALNFGVVSLKYMRLLENGKFFIYNHIDNTKQRLTEKGLFSESNIGEAIEKGAFVSE